MIAQTPPVPYYAVIFTSVRTDIDGGYAIMATLLEELAKRQQGFLGIESARDGVGITVSYWSSLAAIQAWREQVQHAAAQKLGKERWYESYFIRVCLVERAYSFGVDEHP